MSAATAYHDRLPTVTRLARARGCIGGGPRNSPQDRTARSPTLPADREQRRERRPRQAAEIRLALVALLAEGHLLIEDVPGVGKTMLAKAIARSIDCSFRRHPVHARPAAHRRHRRQRLQPGAARLRVQAGRDLRQHRAGRRDQPGLAQDPVGPARVHGGAPGHDRHPDPSAGHPVHGHRDPEPHRARGHLSAARGPARPVHAAAVDRIPVRPRSRPRSWRVTPAGAHPSTTSGR